MSYVILGFLLASAGAKKVKVEPMHFDEHAVEARVKAPYRFERPRPSDVEMRHLSESVFNEFEALLLEIDPQQK